MKLTQIDILKYKSIKQPVSIVFNECQVVTLIGKNGSGKTNVLEALNYIFEANAHSRLYPRLPDNLNYRVHIELNEEDVKSILPEIIFYRDKHGTISSHDLKGKEMIIALKLYRPIHNLAWICEQLKELSQELGDKIENETDSSKKSILLEAHYKLLQYHQKCYCIFIANYNNNESIMQKIYKI